MSFGCILTESHQFLNPCWSSVFLTGLWIASTFQILVRNTVKYSSVNALLLPWVFILDRHRLGNDSWGHLSINPCLIKESDKLTCRVVCESLLKFFTGKSSLDLSWVCKALVHLRKWWFMVSLYQPFPTSESGISGKGSCTSPEGTINLIFFCHLSVQISSAVQGVYILQSIEVEVTNFRTPELALCSRADSGQEGLVWSLSQ